MPRNITDVSQWDDPVPAPQDGEKITADAAAMGDGPVNPGLQALANRDKAIVQGDITIRRIAVDGTGEQAVAGVGAGEIGAAGTIFTSLGNLQAPLGGVQAIYAGLSGTASSTAVPNPTIALGVVDGDDVPLCKALVSSGGVLLRGRNALSATTTGVGVYEVVSNNAPTWTDAAADGAVVNLNAQVTVQASNVPRSVCTACTKVGAGAGKVKVTVWIFNLTPSPPVLVDDAFALVLSP